MDHIPNLVGRGVHIPKHLDPVQGVHADIDPEDLAEGLQVLGASPLAIFASGSYHVLEPALFVLLGWSCYIGRTRSICRGRSPFGAATLTPLGDDELHEILFVVCHVVGQELADLVGMVGVGVQLVGEGIVETIAWGTRQNRCKVGR